MKKSIEKFILSLFLILSVSVLHAQVTPIDPDETEEPGNDKSKASGQTGENKGINRFVFGGNLGLSFGNYTFIDISPIVGYKITPKLTSGVGFIYQYEKYVDPYNNPFNYVDDYKATVLGGKVFSQYDIIYGVFAHAEYEEQYLKYEFLETPYDTGSIKIPALYAGGGYKLKLGENSALQIIALYNFLANNNDLFYVQPWTFRIGFLGGF
ncbi:MAG: hypothetical protein ACKVPJ_04085 [Chitinophagales bacterium]